MASLLDIGLVIIGRNEGERLKACFASIPIGSGGVGGVVYVDSGSADDSVEYAKSIGIEVVQLCMTMPFSASRARNEGFEHLLKKCPHIRYVQFVDGDCEICEGWLQAASSHLETNVSWAIVAGRRKEKFPERSIYNLLCDIEWNTPVGVAKACGGDFMIRVEAFRQVKGFNGAVIAGEEPEMCYRLSKYNWRIIRLDHAMTLHDAAIKRFSQWWRRSLRTGHAYAQGYVLHFRDKQGFCLRESIKIWVWALIFPITIMAMGFLVSSYFFWLITVYLVQLSRIALKIHRRLGKSYDSIFYGFFTVIAKFPQLFGQLLFLKRQLLRKDFTIIEYN